MTGKSVAPTLLLLCRSFSAQSNSVSRQVTLIACMLYGMTLPFGHFNEFYASKNVIY